MRASRLSVNLNQLCPPSLTFRHGHICLGLAYLPILVLQREPTDRNSLTPAESF
jgi:hypothetical protein